MDMKERRNAEAGMLLPAVEVLLTACSSSDVTSPAGMDR